MKNTIEDINSRLKHAEEWIMNEKNDGNHYCGTEKMKQKWVQSQGPLEKNLNCINITIIGVPENEDRKKELGEKMETVTAINFPNMRKINK